MDNHCSWHLFDFVCICLYKVDQPIYIYIYCVYMEASVSESELFWMCSVVLFDFACGARRFKLDEWSRVDT